MVQHPLVGVEVERRGLETLALDRDARGEWVEQVEAAVWDRLLNLQLSFFRRFSTGDLQSRVTAVSQIRSYLGGTTLRTLFSSIVLLLNLFAILMRARISKKLRG